jgi:2-polyprenyl-3-methyl-5-hydroxy-6-metoxy-1,4-benzoquinol methylase
MLLKSRAIHKLINRAPIKRFLTENRSIVRLYFNYLYLREDPYCLAREEEKRKFDHAFGLLKGFKADKGLEIGCGEGRLSPRVAAICNQVLAIDVSDMALRRARNLNQDDWRIKFKQADLLEANFSAERFNFIFCSEVLSYFRLSQLDVVTAKIIDLLQPQGKLLLVHHRSLNDDSSGIPLKEFGAKTIHQKFIIRRQLELEEDCIESEYRLTLMRRLAPMP